MGGSLSRQREEPFADADGGSRKTQRLLGDARWRNSLHAHQPYEKKEKEWNAKALTSVALPKAAMSHSSTQNNVLLRRKYYCGNGNGTA